MIAMRVREIWQRGDAVVNAWLHIPHSYSAEAIAHVGFDAVTCDMQHGLVDYATLIGMLTAISTTGATPLVRVPALDPATIGRVLDAGALGIICPMINTAGDAEKLVGACRYAPQGWRSFGPNRAAFLAPDYVAQANGAIVPFAMIETREALDNLDAILAVEGLQAIYVGPADLSLSLGYVPRADPVDAEVIDIIADIGRRARDKGVIAGIHTGSAAGALAMIGNGYRFVSLPNDRIMMETAARKMLGDVRAGHGTQATDKLAAPGY